MEFRWDCTLCKTTGNIGEQESSHSAEAVQLAAVHHEVVSPNCKAGPYELEIFCSSRRPVGEEATDRRREAELVFRNVGPASMIGIAV